MSETKVWVVLWQHTWGEYHGCIGIYTSKKAAEDALQESEYAHEDVGRIVETVLDREVEFDT